MKNKHIYNTLATKSIVQFYLPAIFYGVHVKIVIFLVYITVKVK